MLAEMKPAHLLQRVENFLATDRGQAILRSGTSYELSRITTWIISARRSLRSGQLTASEIETECVHDHREIMIESQDRTLVIHVNINRATMTERLMNLQLEPPQPERLARRCPNEHHWKARREMVSWQLMVLFAEHLRHKLDLLPQKQLLQRTDSIWTSTVQLLMHQV